MKKLILDHPFTPIPLKNINRDLSELTTDNDPEGARFLGLATEREILIQTYLESLPEDEKNKFATAELKVNGALVAYAEGSYKTSQKELSELVRGRKAVNKYR